MPGVIPYYVMLGDLSLLGPLRRQAARALTKNPNEAVLLTREGVKRFIRIGEIPGAHVHWKELGERYDKILRKPFREKRESHA